MKKKRGKRAVGLGPRKSDRNGAGVDNPSAPPPRPGEQDKPRLQARDDSHQTADAPLQTIPHEADCDRVPTNSRRSRVGLGLWALFALLVGAIIGPLIVEGLKPRGLDPCQVVGQFARVVRLGNWRTGEDLLNRWSEIDMSGDPRCLAELELHRALIELCRGWPSAARRSLTTARSRAGGWAPVGDRADYVESAIDRAAGRIYGAHRRLRGLLAPERIGSLPDDVRFNALYDLTILETHLGAHDRTDERLRQIREHVDNDETRQDRVQLLTALVEYMRGDLQAAEQRLNKITFDDSPTRDGLRCLYLAWCLEGLGRRDEARNARKDAEARFAEADDIWHQWEMKGDAIIRIVDNDEISEASPEEKQRAWQEASQAVKELGSHLDELCKAEVVRSDDCADSFLWVWAMHRLYEAQLALLKYKLQHSDAQSPDTIRRDLQDAMGAPELRRIVLPQVWSHFALATLAQIEHNEREADDHYQQAVGLTLGAGLLREATRAMLKRAGHRRRGGDRDGCRRDVSEAIEIWRRLGNETWVQSLEDYLKGGGCWHTP